MTVSVCLSVGGSVREDISRTTRRSFTKFLYKFAVAVARSCSGGVAIRYVYFRFCGFLRWTIRTWRDVNLQQQPRSNVYTSYCRTLEVPGLDESFVQGVPERSIHCNISLFTGSSL